MYLQIGLMRSGILLACPQTLLSLHGLSTLDDVFLKLCMKDRELSDHRLAEEGVAPFVQTTQTERLKERRIAQPPPTAE